MTVTRMLAGLAVVAAPLAAVAAEPSRMQEGLWEVSVQVELPGIPFKPPATTMKHCYTKEEVESQGGVPQADKDCKVSEPRKSGNTVSWTVTCTGKKNAGTGEGAITFNGPGAYEGKMKMTSGGATLTTLYKGKRLGECK